MVEPRSVIRQGMDAALRELENQRSFRRFFADGQRVARRDDLSSFLRDRPRFRIYEDRNAVDRTFENGA